MPVNQAPARLDAETIRRLCGDIPDETVIAILDAGASLSDLETALAWAEGRSEAMGEEPHPLEGVAARIYDLLIQEEPPFEEG